MKKGYARISNPACDAYAVELFGLTCPPPTLHVATGDVPDQLVLQWSSAYPITVCSRPPSLGGPNPPAFSDVPVTPVLVSGKFAVTNSAVLPREFLRLVK